MAFPSVRPRLIVVKHAVGNLMRAEQVPNLTGRCNIAAQDTLECVPIFILSYYKVSRTYEHKKRSFLLKYPAVTFLTGTFRTYFNKECSY
jgi:hypothetical protein